MDKPIIQVPDMCRKHQRLLLDQLGCGPDGPWRSNILAAQIALFQGSTARPGFYEDVGGDPTNASKLGCLACYAPEVFGQVVQAMKQDGISGSKALGERLIAEADKKRDVNGKPATN